jgi:hypothetical protein
MELYSKFFWLRDTKHGFEKPHASFHGYLATAALLSMAIHASLLLIGIQSNDRVNSFSQSISVVRIDATSGSTGGQVNATVYKQQNEREHIAVDRKPILTQDQAVVIDASLPATNGSQPALGQSDGEEAQEPVKGLAIGGLGFAGFGGGRKRPFEFVTANAEQNSQTANADTNESFARRQMAQALIAELKTDLNQLIPADIGQKCLLQTSLVCQKRNESLEKYLLIKAPSIQQLIAGKMMRITSDDGQWSVEVSN